jgi:hypothetical protein
MSPRRLITDSAEVRHERAEDPLDNPAPHAVVGTQIGMSEAAGFVKQSLRFAESGLLLA